MTNRHEGAARSPEHHAGGAALWDAVTDAYELDPSESALLAQACATLDELRRLTACLATEDVTTYGSTGQEVVNPLVDSIRRHRELLARLLSALNATGVVSDALA